MRDYERVRWESRCLARNCAALRRELAERGHLTLAQEIHAVAEAPGALNACLARAYSDPNGDYQASRVVARLLDLARDAAPQLGADEIVRSLTPLLRWDHGWEPLASGLDELDHSSSVLADALRRPPLDDMAAYVEAIWVVGLLRLAHRPVAGAPGLDALSSELSPSKGAPLAAAAVSSVVRRYIGQFWQSVTGQSGSPPAGRRQKLWELALVSACRHKWLRGGQPEPYACLLSYVAGGGVWPPPWPENDEFRQRAPRGCAGFWNDVQPARYSQPFEHQVEFLVDPLEILNVANAFDTCSRFTGPEERRVLAYATNANYRIIAVRANDGRILARRVVGLRISEEPGVLQCHTYPLGHTTSDEAIDCFLSQFLRQACLDPIDPEEGRGVEKTVAPPYNKGWIPWER